MKNDITTLPDIKDVDLCIFTDGNREGLEKLLYSILRYQKGARIVIADSSIEHDRAYFKDLRNDLIEAGLLNRAIVHQIPYASSEADARNFLMVNTPMMYKVFLKDTDLFTEETNLGEMVHILDNHPAIGLVVGTVDGKAPVKIGGDMDQDGVAFFKTPVCSTFFMARRDLHNFVRWGTAPDIDADYSNCMKQVPYEMVGVATVAISKQVIDNNAKDEKSNGDSSGGTTKRDIQSRDADKGNAPVLPSGQNEKGKNTITFG